LDSPEFTEIQDLLKLFTLSSWAVGFWPAELEEVSFIKQSNTLINKNKLCYNGRDERRTADFIHAD